VHAEQSPNELDPVLQQAVAWLREPVVFPKHGGVEAALERLPRLRRPRAVMAWPWLAAAAAFGILVTRLAPDRPGIPDADSLKRVRFAVNLAAGEEVALIGDFNDWNPEATPLHREQGSWSATLPLAPGRYRYAYVVDGRRLLADPSGPLADDEFGAPTSVITVPN
jgi:hypothetical protein